MLLRDTNAEIRVASRTCKHMAQSDASFADHGQVWVEHMEIGNLIRILDSHIEITILLDDRDVVFHSGGKQFRC